MSNNVQVTFRGWLDSNQITLLAEYNLKFAKFEQYRWDLFVEQQYIAYARSGRRIVSEQGASITSGQRARMAQQQQVRSFMNPVLAESVAETLKVLQVTKEQGVSKWIDPNKFNIVDFKSIGTPSVAEWMGF